MLNLLSSVIDPLEDFAKAALANPLLLREDNLRVHFLHKRREYEYMFKIFVFKCIFIINHVTRTSYPYNSFHINQFNILDNREVSSMSITLDLEGETITPPTNPSIFVNRSMSIQVSSSGEGIPHS